MMNLLVEQGLRAFVEGALQAMPSAHCAAHESDGATERAYQRGFNDGVEETLLRVQSYLTDEGVA